MGIKSFLVGMAVGAVSTISIPMIAEHTRMTIRYIDYADAKNAYFTIRDTIHEYGYVSVFDIVYCGYPSFVIPSHMRNKQKDAIGWTDIRNFKLSGNTIIASFPVSLKEVK